MQVNSCELFDVHLSFFDYFGVFILSIIDIVQ